MKKGLLFVLSGSSGSGKGTVLKEVMKKRELFYSVSATSRLPRAGEVEGVNYRFVTREQFKAMAERGEFLEYTETYGNCYGTPVQPVLEAMSAGKDILLEIDLAGAMNIRACYPSAVLIFLAPPTVGELVHRLVKRGTETYEQIESRIGYYVKELNSASGYDYVVVNDDVSKAAAEIVCIMEAERLKVKNNLDFISELTGGIKI